MKRNFLVLLMSLCLALPACVYADETPAENVFLTKFVSQVPYAHRIGMVELKENQSSITVDFSKVSNPCSNYYIGLYYIDGDMDDPDYNADYIIKNVGPITTDKFVFTGLKSGIKYRIHLASAINIEDVDGVFYVE